MKINHYLFAAAMLCILSSLSFSSCVQSVSDGNTKDAYGNTKKWGEVIRKDLSLKDFKSINLDGDVDVVFTQSDTISVEVMGNEKVIDMYNFDVSNGILNVYYKSEKQSRIIPIVRLYVSAPTLQSVTLSGAGDIKIHENVVFEDFSINVTGAGDVDMENLGCGNLDIKISGAGDVDAEDVICKSLSVDISGSGDIDLSTVNAEGDANMSMSGAGGIKSKILCENINASASGAGDLDLKVNCKQISIEISGVGDVELSGKAKKLKRNVRGFANVDTKELSVDEIEY